MKHMLKQGEDKVLRNEKGFASIVIALIMVIVLALITVGFAQLSRREQQNALTKQLATQANYAAESGINDVLADIKSGVITEANDSNPGDDTMNTCIKPAGSLIEQNSVDSSTGVTYSCVLANLTPTKVTYDNVGKYSDKTTIFSTSATDETIDITWSSVAGNSTFPAYTTGNSFLPVASWTNRPAVLQFSIVPLSLGVDRDSLVNNNFTAYLFPASGGIPTLVDYSTNVADQGKVIGHCDAVSKQCTASVKMAGTGGTGPFLIHVVNLYDASNITIGPKDNLGSPLQVKDGQYVIDVTGKARNVLKRLRVVVPVRATANTPGFALEGSNICKQIYAVPAAPATPTGSSYNTALSATCDLSQNN